MAESLQQLKNRLRGIQNISQITKAMELVAATKMRRSQEAALASRPYAFAALEMLANLSRTENPGFDEERTALLQKRVVQRTAFVLVTSDKGLAGAFNSNVLRAFESFTKEDRERALPARDYFVGVGQKAAAYLQRNWKLDEKFIRFGDYTTIEEIEPLAAHLIDGFLRGTWDRVLVFSAHFHSALRQDVVIREVLPVDFETIRATAREIIPETGRFAELMKENGLSFFANESKEDSETYLIEPSPAEVIQELAAHLVLMEIYHLVLEANASEHAARRSAMKNASDNASELIGDLTLVYNKSRQAGITKELTELTAGAEALK